MASFANTTATPQPQPATGAFWDNFQAGVVLAERDLPQLGRDLLRLPRIVADPAPHGLGEPGALHGYLARVAEAAAAEAVPNAPRAADPATDGILAAKAEAQARAAHRAGRMALGRALAG
jgi:hypothetical protein